MRKTLLFFSYNLVLFTRQQKGGFYTKSALVETLLYMSIPSFLVNVEEAPSY